MGTTYAEEAAGRIVAEARRQTDLLFWRDRKPALEMAAAALLRMAGTEEPKRSPSTANFRAVKQIFEEVPEFSQKP